MFITKKAMQKEFDELEQTLRKCNEQYIVAAEQMEKKLSDVDAHTTGTQDEWKQSAAEVQGYLGRIENQLAGQSGDLKEFTPQLTKLFGSLNYYNNALRQLTQNVELLRGDFATLNEIFLIPYEQPFPLTDNKYTLGGRGLETLLAEYEFQTVLDIGCGKGQHTQTFLEAGKEVYVNDIFESDFVREHKQELHLCMGDFMLYPFDVQFDCVWACHVLEHSLNPHDFLCRIHEITKEDGVVCITIPPPRQLIGGGHVNNWNMGLLIYRLVLAGFDCSEARLMRYGYNQTVILRKHSINVQKGLVYDTGDIETISPYLPKNIEYIKTATDYLFDGRMPGIMEQEAEAKTEIMQSRETTK